MDTIDQLKAEEKQKNGEFDEFETAKDWSCEWLWGFVLIGLGLVFLLRPFTGLFLGNWWALFLLIPGLIKVGQAFQGGRIHKGSLSGGLFMVLIGSVFLLGLSWSLFWPFLLILIGIMAFMPDSK